MSPESQAPDGAEPLEPKREAFVRNLFEGIEINQAYEAAGYKRPRGNAWRMFREPEVQARLEYLRRELDEMEMANRAWRRRKLREYLQLCVYEDRSGMMEQTEGEHGRRYLQIKTWDELTERQRLLVEGVGDGGRVMLPSKLSAAAQLARLDGLDAPTKIAPTNPDGDEPVSNDEALEQLAQSITLLAGRLNSMADADGDR